MSLTAFHAFGYREVEEFTGIFETVTPISLRLNLEELNNQSRNSATPTRTRERVAWAERTPHGAHSSVGSDDSGCLLLRYVVVPPRVKRDVNERGQLDDLADPTIKNLRVAVKH